MCSESINDIKFAREQSVYAINQKQQIVYIPSDDKQFVCALFSLGSEPWRSKLTSQRVQLSNRLQSE
jgi:hypothetical protein